MQFLKVWSGALTAVCMAVIITGASPTPAPATSDEVDTKQIVRHVVPRDAILALVLPDFVSVGDAAFMRADDRVITVDAPNDARAYPIRILEHHEIVNDFVGSGPLLVTY